jgi:antimicrobial peptide system SdpA family protein
MKSFNKKESVRVRASGAIALFVGASLLVATTYVGTGNVETPIRMPFADRFEMAVMAPEGWKFFTKDPQAERLYFFRHEENAWHSASRGTNAEPSNFFGMSRDGRTQGMEAAVLMKNLPEASWKACDDTPSSCLATDGDVVHVQNDLPLPTLCGSIGLVLQKPVPWTWAKLSHPVTMPSRVTRLEVKC